MFYKIKMVLCDRIEAITLEDAVHDSELDERLDHFESQYVDGNVYYEEDWIAEHRLGDD